MKENTEFNEYIKEFKLLPLHEKERIVETQTKQLVAFIEKLKKDLNIKSDLLFNKEILDLKKESHTSDDFVEAMMVYITMIQESFSGYVDLIVNVLYKEDK